MRIHGVYRTDPRFRLKKVERPQTKERGTEPFRLEDDQERQQQNREGYVQLQRQYDVKNATFEQLQQIAHHLLAMNEIDKALHRHMTFLRPHLDVAEQRDWIEFFRQEAITAQRANRLTTAQLSRSAAHHLTRFASSD